MSTSREIQIRRKERVNSTLPPEVINEARLKIGSVFVSGTPLSGLDPDDERKYLPAIVKVGPDNHTEWPRRVADFWADMGVVVPSGGTVLEIGEHEDGTPIRPLDWIKYKWLLRHPLVGETKDKMNEKGGVAYIFDPEYEDMRANKRMTQKMAALTEYMKLIDKSRTDDKKLDRVTRILIGVNPKNMTRVQKENQLETIASTDPRRFYKVCVDKDLEFRAEIEDMIEAGVLDQIGAHIKYGTDTLGHSMEEAIEFFKDKTNVKTVSTMRTRAEVKSGGPVNMNDLAI